MRESRIQMTAEGFYDPEMMKILKRIRCRLDGSLGECADKREL
ncbi:putative solute-binding protein [Klebsiella pneumoniae]